MNEGNKPMEIDSSDSSNGIDQSSNEKPLIATPVDGGSSGKGLPYAPEDWPRPGDVWTWKVGKRMCAAGHWVDKSIYPPRNLKNASGNKLIFHSKSSLAQYIKTEYPEVDVNAFFASFIWRVPATGHIKEGNVPLLGNEARMLGTLDIATVDSMNWVEPSRENDAVDGRAQGNLYITSDHSNLSQKLEDEIDMVLQELKRSQESEYQVAEQKLYAQKDFLLGLYQQLETERSVLASPMPLLPNGSENDNLLTNVLNRVDQIKREEAKLKEMLKIARGFGETPKPVLYEYFGLPIND